MIDFDLFTEMLGCATLILNNLDPNVTLELNTETLK